MINEEKMPFATKESRSETREIKEITTDPKIGYWVKVNVIDHSLILSIQPIIKMVSQGNFTLYNFFDINNLLYLYKKLE